MLAQTVQLVPIADDVSRRSAAGNEQRARAGPLLQNAAEPTRQVASRQKTPAHFPNDDLRHGYADGILFCPTDDRGTTREFGQKADISE